MDIEAAIDEIGDKLSVVATEDEVRAIIAAAFPWRPVAEDMPRNRVVQVRVPDGSRFILAEGGASETVQLGYWHAREHQQAGLSTTFSRLDDLIAAGAEWREMLP